jgi:hypothetical protein
VVHKLSKKKRSTNLRVAVSEQKTAEVGFIEKEISAGVNFLYIQRQFLTINVPVVYMGRDVGFGIWMGE